MFELFIAGEPAPQGSKSVGRNGQLYESSKKVAPWRRAVADAVGAITFEKFETPVEVWATFYLTRPRSVKRLLPHVPPDLDKLERGLNDALTIAGVWADDSLIVRAHAQKFYADDRPSGCHVIVREFSDVPLLII